MRRISPVIAYFSFILIVFGGLAFAHPFGFSGPYPDFHFVTTPKLNEPVQILFRMMDENDRIIPELEVVHERLLHVIIVGEDLKTFMHIHPEDFKNGLNRSNEGIYSVTPTFPAAGKYVFIFDYGFDGKSVSNLVPFRIYGDIRLEKPRREFSTKKTVQGYEVELEKPFWISANKEAQFVFYLSKNGEQIRDLQMYLGSEVHAITIKEDLSLAEHTHAYRPAHYLHTGAMKQRYFGPSIPIRLNLQEPGTYALFAQFQIDDEVIAVPFFIKVHSLFLPLMAGFALNCILIVGIIFAIVRSKLSKKKHKIKKPKK